MNVILIASINSALCLILLLMTIIRAAEEGVMEENGAKLFVVTAFTIFGFILLFSFPYSYITVCEYRWYYFPISLIPCAVSATVAYRKAVSKNDEYADPLTSALIAALAAALIIQTLFWILLANGIYTYTIPNGEHRAFHYSFFESLPVTEPS